MATKKQTLEDLFVEEPGIEPVQTSKDVIILQNENNILKQKIYSLEQELAAALQEVKSWKKSNEEIAANEHTVRKNLEKFQVEADASKKLIEAKDKQIELLKADLTRLANLFDEYINAYQDQNKMLGVFFKNAQTVEKYLAIKIEEYNGGSKK
jgi:chromosome segregation ATPase